MTITILYKADVSGTDEAHTPWCTDITKKLNTPGWCMYGNFSTIEQAARDLFGDMLEEGSMDLEEAVDSIKVLPCVNKEVK
jgi:hypothetical protein